MSINSTIKQVLLGAGESLPPEQSTTALLTHMIGAFEPKLGATPTGTTDAYCLTQYDGDTSPAWNTIEDALGYTPMPSFNLSDIFNNAGHTHLSNNDFNALTTYAAHFVHSTVTSGHGPAIPGATQYYGFTLGLGADYNPSNEACQLYWPRTPYGGNPYLSLRFREGTGDTAWTAWSKVYAGYADSAGNATTTSQTTFGSLNVGSATGAEIGDVRVSGDVYLADNSGALSRESAWVSPTDHFATFSSVWAWASSPFDGAPSYAETSTFPGLLLLRDGYTTHKNFAYRACGSDVDMCARLSCGIDSYVGLRIDDGSDNNYIEMRFTAMLITQRYRSGGDITETTIAAARAEWYIFRLARAGGINYWFYGVNTPFPQYITSNSATWTASRAGIIFGQRGIAYNPDRMAAIDWIRI